MRGLKGVSDRLDGLGDASGERGPCDGLRTRCLAVRAAVEQVGLVILYLHLQRCVLDGVPVGEEKMRALRDSLKLWSRLSSG